MAENLRRIKYYNRKNIFKNLNYFRKKYIKDCAKKHNFHPVFEDYADRKIISYEKTNDIIAQYLESNEPFLVSRFGNTELSTISYYIMMKNIKCPRWLFFVWCGIIGKVLPLPLAYKKAKKFITTFSGFFPAEDQQLEKFVDLMISGLPYIDILGTWDINMEEYFIETYMPDVVLSDLYYLEPWFSEKPWSAKLKGKKVLVIHPFEDTIISQYQKREKIFPNTEVLPEFELLTLKAVQTIAGTKDERFETWFEALEYMYQSAIGMDFDVAIIGCGAYGMPLGVKLKMAGKQVIHLGGATQLLFGIKGARWENADYPSQIASLFNEYWVRPGEKDKVTNSRVVENNCYW